MLEDFPLCFDSLSTSSKSCECLAFHDNDFTTNKNHKNYRRGAVCHLALETLSVIPRTAVSLAIVPKRILMQITNRSEVTKFRDTMASDFSSSGNPDEGLHHISDIARREFGILMLVALADLSNCQCSPGPRNRDAQDQMTS